MQSSLSGVLSTWHSVRRRKNRVQRIGRERGKQCSVCAHERERWGAVSHSHLRGTHLAFTQRPGGIWRPGFLLPRLCVCLFTAFVLSLFQTDPLLLLILLNLFWHLWTFNLARDLFSCLFYFSSNHDRLFHSKPTHVWKPRNDKIPQYVHGQKLLKVWKHIHVFSKFVPLSISLSNGCGEVCAVQFGNHLSCFEGAILDLVIDDDWIIPDRFPAIV